MKKFIAVAIAVIMVLPLVLTSCGTPAKEQSEVQKIIAQAQTMSLEELARKAIEESNGKTFYGVGIIPSSNNFLYTVVAAMIVLLPSILLR